MDHPARAARRMVFRRQPLGADCPAFARTRITQFAFGPRCIMELGMSTLRDRLHDMSAASSGRPRLRKTTPSPRKQQILDIAARLFAVQGFTGTSIRQIGEEAGVLGGSLYHHIRSKEALFVEVHNMAIDALAANIEANLTGLSDPWERLEEACSVFLERQLESDHQRLPWIREIVNVPPEVRRQIIARRDEFDVMFDQMIGALDLDEEVNRTVYRNSLLTLLSNTSSWYRKGKLTPREIAHQIILMLRH
jgi:TetR/AcrR family transcriptional regulator, cholesterol catabolism regulator